MPVDYKKYPPNWLSEIRPRVLERENNCCKFCGVENKKPVVSKRSGNTYKIVLTIAHLDHDEENWQVQDDRLAALCQPCHLKYDAKEKARRRNEKKQEDRFKEELQIVKQYFECDLINFLQSKIEEINQIESLGISIDTIHLWRKRRRNFNYQSKQRLKKIHNRENVDDWYQCVDIIKILLSQGINCYLCDVKTSINPGVIGADLPPDQLTFDHLIDLDGCGRHNESNIRVCCFKCNNEKNKHKQIMRNGRE